MSIGICNRPNKAFGLIANDLRTGAILVYLSRPLTRRDYVLGKLCVLLAIVLSVTLLPGLLLYLADNPGEQFFDRPLVSHLRDRGWQVLYAVKGGPIQNDLTREDLYASGVGEELEPVADTGARTVGLNLSQISPAFRRLWERADLVVAKGMGHFETMSAFDAPRVFFLLQAKCAAVAQALEVPRGSFVLRRR